MKKWILITGVGLVLVILDLALVSIFFHLDSNPHATPGRWQIDPLRIRAAARAYAQDLQAKGGPVPAEVALDVLVAQGFLRPADVRGTEGVELRVGLQTEDAPPSRVLVRAKLRDGSQFVLLNDGSVQQVKP